MEIVVFGAGYVGLVTGAGLASTGNHITLADPLKDRIQSLNDGHCPIYEPGLEDLLSEARRTKNIQFVLTETPAFSEVLERAEIYFIAVGTPEGADGRTRMEYVDSAVKMIANQAGTLSEKIVVMKSTVPVGTGDHVESLFAQYGKTPVVVSNPEFLKQGNAVQDFLKPERVIIGTENERAREVLSFLHKPFMMKQNRVVFTTRRSAELVKYACNTFLAMKISFINEMAQLAEICGADIREIREGMITDSRIGDQFLFPGIGYGGSCFPKDVHSLIVQAHDFGHDLRLAKAADDVNRKQRSWPFRKIENQLSASKLSQATIALWGLAFKPNTDDIREAPATELVETLLSRGCLVRAHDPVAGARVQALFPDAIKSGQLQILEDPYATVEKAQALVILTEWRHFRTPNFVLMKKLMKNPLIIDGRNILEKKLVENYGFQYISVGSQENRAEETQRGRSAATRGNTQVG